MDPKHRINSLPDLRHEAFSLAANARTKRWHLAKTLERWVFVVLFLFWGGKRSPQWVVESKKQMYITQVWRIWIYRKRPWSQDFENKARDRTDLHVMPEYLKYGSRCKTSEIRSLDPSRCIFAAHDFCNSSVCLHCGCLNAAQKDRFTNLAALSRRKSPKI